MTSWYMAEIDLSGSESLKPTESGTKPHEAETERHRRGAGRLTQRKANWKR